MYYKKTKRAAARVRRRLFNIIIAAAIAVAAIIVLFFTPGLLFLDSFSYKTSDNLIEDNVCSVNNNFVYMSGNTLFCDNN